MNKQDLINEFNSNTLDRFTSKLNRDFSDFLKSNQNEAIKNLHIDLKKIIEEINIMLEKVDYRQISFSEYENSIPQFKQKVLDIINQLPSVYFQ